MEFHSSEVHDEREREKLEEDKRRWKVEKMLDDLPDTPEMTGEGEGREEPVLKRSTEGLRISKKERKNARKTRAKQRLRVRTGWQKWRNVGRRIKLS